MRPSRLRVLVCVGGLTKSTGPKELICFTMTDSRTLKDMLDYAETCPEVQREKKNILQELKPFHVYSILKFEKHKYRFTSIHRIIVLSKELY